MGVLHALLRNQGAIHAALWNELAEQVCDLWRSVQERRQRGERVVPIIELLKFRIQGLAKNKWNGESLTQIRILSSADGIDGADGSTLSTLARASAENMTSMTFTVPSSSFCVSSFRSLRNKLTSPFRVTLKGKIVDLQGTELSQSGQPKRVFDLLDNSGLYIKCCAQKHNCESTALHNYQEIVVYFGTGRGPIGGSPGMVYLMKDAMIIPVGQPSPLNSGKVEQLAIL